MGRYCIIGAGAAGLSALQLLTEAGYDVTCFEKTDRTGGHWNTDYEALHLITSRDATMFPDYPMPEEYPHFPSRGQVVDYIRSYAQDKGLDDRITFGVEVVSVTPEPTDTDEPVGAHGWHVTSSRGDEGHFDGVLVANGHLWDPKVPEVASGYTGRSMHTSDYSNTDDLTEGTTLVVGAGNSGCDIAADIAQTRKPVDIVVRRGIYFQPKMYFGIPRSDVSFLQGFSPEEQDLINRLMARLSLGENSAYPGLPMPEAGTLADGATTVNNLLLYWVQHGRIGIRPGITSIEGTTVTFSDGTFEEYDNIVWATGFNVKLPFLDEDLLPWLDGAPIRYAGGILPEGAENLYFVGLIAPRGPQIPVYGEQVRRILRMVALRENTASTEGRQLNLAAYFARAQEPEALIDVVRAKWDEDMADTDRQLAALESVSSLQGASS